MFNNDNDNVIGSLLGTLFFAGAIYLARRAGRSDYEEEVNQKNKEDELTRLRMENEALKKQVPQVLRDLPPTRF